MESVGSFGLEFFSKRLFLFGVFGNPYADGFDGFFNGGDLMGLVGRAEDALRTDFESFTIEAVVEQVLFVFGADEMGFGFGFRAGWFFLLGNDRRG